MPGGHIRLGGPGAETESPHDLLIAVVDRRGLRARRSGDQARIDPPQRPGTAAARAGLDVGALVKTLSPLLPPGNPPAQVVVAVQDVARVLDPALLRDRLGAAANAPAVVCDSMVTTLFGALGEVGPGTVADLGVGVGGLATDLGAVWHRIDGWGPILGDRGSAAWVGAQGLSAALRARDGVPGGSDQLLEAGRHSFGDESRWPELLEENPAAEVLADFAPVVGEVAERGDEVARAIVMLAGEHLADVLCAGEQVVPGAPITATGELLLVRAVKVALASALGKRTRFLTPAFGDSLAGARHLGNYLAGGGTLPHRPPLVYVQGQSALTS